MQQVKITQTFNITSFVYLINAINIWSVWVSSISSVIALPVKDIMNYNQAEELNKATFGNISAMLPAWQSQSEI